MATRGAFRMQASGSCECEKVALGRRGSHAGRWCERKVRLLRFETNMASMQSPCKLAACVVGRVGVFQCNMAS